MEEMDGPNFESPARPRTAPWANPEGTVDLTGLHESVLQALLRAPWKRRTDGPFMYAETRVGAVTLPPPLSRAGQEVDPDARVRPSGTYAVLVCSRLVLTEGLDREIGRFLMGVAQELFHRGEDPGFVCQACGGVLVDMGPASPHASYPDARRLRKCAACGTTTTREA